LPEHEEIVPQPTKPVHEFEPMDEDTDDEPQRQRIMQRTMGTVARQISLDSGGDMQMCGDVPMPLPPYARAHYERARKAVKADAGMGKGALAAVRKRQIGIRVPA
jgi:hypothetical protein